MSHVFVRQNVKNYSEWKAVFDNDIDVRQAGGSIGARVFRDADGSNAVSIMMEFKDVESAQALVARMQTPEMQKLMADGGVLGPSEVLYIFGGVEDTSA